MEETTITRLDKGTEIYPEAMNKISHELLIRDCKYQMAQKMRLYCTNGG